MLKLLGNSLVITALLGVLGERVAGLLVVVVLLVRTGHQGPDLVPAASAKK